MKITVYTINDCKFSQAEKEYLKSKNLQFEEKNLETNREYLTEMLEVSNNFAGTPVTKIEKDDGSSVVLKGFTQSEFDSALGMGTDPTTQSAPAASSSTETSTPTAGATTAAVAQAGSDMSTPTETSTSNMDAIPAAASVETPSMDQNIPSAPSKDMSQPTTPLADQSTPSAPDMGTPTEPSSSPDMNSNPMGTDASPSMPSMDQATPAAPSTPAAPTAAPSIDMQPQGEAIPNPISTDSQNPSDTSSPMGAQETPDQNAMGMGTGAPDMNAPVQPTTPPADQSNTGANDPLNSVLNDLQSKGNGGN